MGKKKTGIKSQQGTVKKGKGKTTKLECSFRQIVRQILAPRDVVFQDMLVSLIYPSQAKARYDYGHVVVAAARGDRPKARVVSALFHQSSDGMQAAYSAYHVHSAHATTALPIVIYGSCTSFLGINMQKPNVHFVAI